MEARLRGRMTRTERRPGRSCRSRMMAVIGRRRRSSWNQAVGYGALRGKMARHMEFRTQVSVDPLANLIRLFEPAITDYIITRLFPSFTAKERLRRRRCTLPGTE